MKKCIVCLALTMFMSMNAFALEVPTETVIQNLNGNQQAIKTYQLQPDQDPQILIEEPFELEGYRYTFADIVKTENAIHESKLHTETVTIETESSLRADVSDLPSTVKRPSILLRIRQPFTR